MKLQLILLAASCLASSALQASAGKTHSHSPDGSLSTGTSKQFRTEDNLGNFNFGYDESHNTGSTSRREENNNGIRRGMYSLYDADGRQRIVNYVADENGFRAQVQSNEPGFEQKDSADVLVTKNSNNNNNQQQQQQQYGASVAAKAPVYAKAPRPSYAAAPTKSYSAPQPAKSYSPPLQAKSYAAPAPVKSYSAPAPVKSYSAPAPVKSYSAPVEQAPVYRDQQQEEEEGQQQQQQAYEEPEASPEPSGPWSFSYSFDSVHAAPAKTYAAEAPAQAVKSYPAQAKSYAAPLKSYTAAAPAPVKSYTAAPVYQEQQQREEQQQEEQQQEEQQPEQQQQQQQRDQQSFDY